MLRFWYRKLLAMNRGGGQMLMSLGSDVEGMMPVMLNRGYHVRNPSLLMAQGESNCCLQCANNEVSMTRQYSKSKDKKKEKKPHKIEINEQQLSEVFNYQGVKGQMENTIKHMHEDFVKQLSLRSASLAIEKLRVNVDGKEHELQQLAQISRKNPKTVVVNMIGFPQLIPDVLLAIDNSGMNLNPQQDGTTLFIPIPKVTKEHRENLSKNAKSLFIKCRDALKDLQNKTIKKVKNKKISEDEMYSIQNQITAMTDKYVGEATKILEAKQKELLDNA